jgi:hypothetical protein
MLQIFLGVVLLLVGMYSMVRGSVTITTRRNVLTGKRAVKKYNGITAYFLILLLFLLGGVIIYNYFYSPTWFTPAFILIFVLMLLIFIFGYPAAESKE